MCSYAKNKDMLVGITIFTGWSKHDYSWVFHPLNINNGGHLTNKEDAVIIVSPGSEVWEETWSDSWANSKKTQWVWEQAQAIWNEMEQSWLISNFGPASYLAE